MDHHMPTSDRRPLPQLIGLVGGLGPAATVHYYREIVHAHAALGSSARIVIAHADVNLVLRAAASGDRAELASHLDPLVEQLARAGAAFAAIGAITPHLAIRELAARSTLPLIDVVQLTRNHLVDAGLAKVALLGTRATMESRLFGGLEGIEIVDPEPDQTAAIHDLYVALVRAERASDPINRAFQLLVTDLRERSGANALVLAGTELALLRRSVWGDVFVVECARLHVQAIVRRATTGWPAASTDQSALDGARV